MRTIISLAIIALLLCTGCGPKHYSATASIQVQQPTPDTSEYYAHSKTQSNDEWFATQISILNSAVIIKEVAERLEGSPHFAQFTNPYPKGAVSSEPIYIIGKYRSVSADPKHDTISVNYTHPNPEIAAVVANFFAEEYVNYCRKLNVDESMINIEDLRFRAVQQKNRVEELELKLAELRESSSTIQEYDALLRDFEVQQKFFRALNSRMTQEKACNGTLLPKYPRITEPATPPK